jgi:hypothetical protein
VAAHEQRVYGHAVSKFFAPPPSPWPEQAGSFDSPPWTGRPQGPPPGAVVNELLLGRSQQATIFVDYVDAYPEGFELKIRASTSVAYHELAFEGDESGPDPFGRHWPIVGQPRDVLPPELLRIGVQYADGRTATNIGGHDRPVGGPVIDALRGGGHSGAGESRFDQAYWISPPLPPPGPVAVVCEWPAVEIAVARREIDGQLILDAVERARAMFGDGQHVLKDGREWRLGAGRDVAWINEGTSAGVTITSAVPPVFASYCTLELPGNYTAELARHERAVIELLIDQTPQQPWWLGYLDTGASDVVFPYAPRTTAYYGYGYVLIEAGPQQAAGWREKPFNWALPELMFPTDRSWLVSTMWDDDWSSIGGSQQLVDGMLNDATLGPKARRVDLGQDPTPPSEQQR